jgi:hypothetical protein
VVSRREISDGLPTRTAKLAIHCLLPLIESSQHLTDCGALDLHPFDETNVPLGRAGNRCVKTQPLPLRRDVTFLRF